MFRGVGSARDTAAMREGAVFVELANMVVHDIRRGALRAGDRLPSQRAFAARMRVNRNTVVAAFDELTAQGWVVSRGAAGTFVADEIPDRPPGRAGGGVAARPGFDLRTIAVAPWPGGARDAKFRVSIGVPDPRLVPVDVLARAYRRALRGQHRAALEYSDPRGSERLRKAISAMLRHQRGIPCGPEHVLITNGSQMALELCARVLIEPAGHGAIAVEALGYRQAWRAFEEAGARLVGVPVDGAGLVVDALPAALRAIYVTPHHQYPTTVLMSPARRLALLGHARANRVAVLEDDYDHEFHFDGRPVAPLAAEDAGGNVIYVGTLSKVLAPGLRLGFVAAPERVVERLGQLRAVTDRQGDQIVEHAVAELIEDGELARHTRRSRAIYGERRAALLKTLARELPGVLEIALPPGGITVWARVAEHVHVERWKQRAAEQGVALATGRDFDHDGRALPYVRLAFARYTEAEMAEAVRRLAKALRAAR
jgi:GntR family transcriptional regulator/MocR family aminotransferase